MHLLVQRSSLSHNFWWIFGFDFADFLAEREGSVWRWVETNPAAGSFSEPSKSENIVLLMGYYLQGRGSEIFFPDPAQLKKKKSDPTSIRNEKKIFIY